MSSTDSNPVAAPRSARAVFPFLPDPSTSCFPSADPLPPSPQSARYLPRGREPGESRGQQSSALDPQRSGAAKEGVYARSRTRARRPTPALFAAGPAGRTFLFERARGLALGFFLPAARHCARALTPLAWVSPPGAWLGS